jgi:hypothetical protein
MATEAISAGLLVPSNWWRATEVAAAVALTGIAEAAGYRRWRVASPATVVSQVRC